jgi:membrane protease YdiL (CAAX protease family)
MELTSLVKRHPLAAFCGASVVVGSAVTLLSAQLPANSPLRPLAAIPVSFVPAACALTVLRMAGSDEDRLALRRRLTTIRVGWRWYVVALVALPAAHLAGVALATLPRGAVGSHPAALALLPLFLVTSLGEEIGWRGYALPKLQERFSPLAAALILGVVWSAFHWAALLSNSEAPTGVCRREHLPADRGERDHGGRLQQRSRGRSRSGPDACGLQHGVRRRPAARRDG